MIGVPIGKAMTGLLAGFLYKRLRLGGGSGRSILAVPATLASFIPESIYTAFYFLYAVTLINIAPMSFMILLVIPKGWVEITVMSIMMGALAGNAGFIEAINRFLNQQKNQKE